MANNPTRARSADLWRAGTDRWAGVRAAGVVWDPPAGPTLVIVPHPDDETLGCGGLIARQRSRNVPVTVYAVTDGEAAYPGVDRDRLAVRRRAEQRAALDALCLGDTVHRLGMPDGSVAAHESALGALIAHGAKSHQLVVAPWVHDHHADHDACGRAARTALDGTDIELIHTLFWAWHRAEHDELHSQRLLTISLTDAERSARDRAIACHASQVTDIVASPMLTCSDLEPLRWSTEHYVTTTPA